MMENYIPRFAEGTIKKIAETFPAIALTGPRQSGKTTLARRIFGDRPYVSLEDPDNRDFAANDPRAFLRRYEGGAVFDEVQRVPEIFSWLQGVLDDGDAMGRFVLTGSQQFGLMSGISQTLAGRVAEVRLMPLCIPELLASDRLGGLDSTIYNGTYPAVYSRKVAPEIWHNNYVQTYLERDVRSMTAVHDMSAFQRFLRLAAGRCGQLLNLSSLGADAGVSHNTVRAWLSILEASFIAFLLQPYHRNYNKRLVKSPKLYFYDTGLACRLIGISDPAQIAVHPFRGALFENLVVSDVFKSYFNRGLTPQCYFWRDSGGHEVDLIAEDGLRVTPVEIKSGTTVASDFLDGLKRWNQLSGGGDGVLIYGGDDCYRREGFTVTSWKNAYDLPGIRG
jgi:predicted AAA+ superfamily ATPase